jgi:hypothetical protein
VVASKDMLGMVRDLSVDDVVASKDILGMVRNTSRGSPMPIPGGDGGVPGGGGEGGVGGDTLIGGGVNVRVGIVGMSG